MRKYIPSAWCSITACSFISTTFSHVGCYHDACWMMLISFLAIYCFSVSYSLSIFVEAFLSLLSRVLLGKSWATPTPTLVNCGLTTADQACCQGAPFWLLGLYGSVQIEGTVSFLASNTSLRLCRYISVYTCTRQCWNVLFIWRWN